MTVLLSGSIKNSCFVRLYKYKLGSKKKKKRKKMKRQAPECGFINEWALLCFPSAGKGKTPRTQAPRGNNIHH